jgi:hypothetical protein
VLPNDTAVNKVVQDFTYILAVELHLAKWVLIRKHRTNPSFDITKLRDGNLGNLKELGVLRRGVTLDQSVAGFIPTTIGGEPIRKNRVEDGDHPAAGDLKVDLVPLEVEVQRGVENDE